MYSTLKPFQAPGVPVLEELEDSQAPARPPGHVAQEVSRRGCDLQVFFGVGDTQRK